MEKIFVEQISGISTEKESLIIKGSNDSIEEGILIQEKSDQSNS